MWNIDKKETKSDLSQLQIAMNKEWQQNSTIAKCLLENDQHQKSNSIYALMLSEI